MERRIVSVGEFCKAFKNVLAAEVMLNNIAVGGEISGFKISGEHAYFTLKDEEAALPCSCFNYRRTYVPKEGESVIAVGSPDYYLKGGKFSFVVRSIEAVGLGLLYLKIEQLKKELAAAGVFDASHKKPVPAFCKSICVVTSATGAVIRDIIKTVRLKNPVIDITVKDVRVQGAGAEKEIASAIKAVDRLGYDCIIVARGGGSLEDLMPFYTREVAMAVYEADTPIISAVGHETDFSICDFAADLRAATPTAAAEAAAFDYYRMRSDILSMAARIRERTVKRLTDGFNDTKYSCSLLSAKLQKKSESDYAKVRIALLTLKQQVETLYRARAFEIEKCMTALDKLNPVKVLKSGYFRIYAGGLPVMSVKEVKAGDLIEARGADGRITAKVEKVEEENL